MDLLSQPHTKESSWGFSGRLALRPQEVASALGVSEGTIRKMLPELPHTYIGRCIVIPIHSLQQWLDDKVQSESKDKLSQEILKTIDSSPV